MSTVKAYYDGITFFPMETLTIPIGKVVNLTIDEEEQKRPIAGNWVNPLLGLAKTKGAKLTLERFLEMQQEEIERENENDRRLWANT